MPQQFDSWASYFYPETYDAQTGHGVLRNVPGIRDFAALRSYDYRMSFARRTELELRPELVARTFDGEHIKAIHKQLFQDVYPWAGLRALLRQMHHSPISLGKALPAVSWTRLRRAETSGIFRVNRKTSWRD